ncbi:hypothetical protein [Armatimonas rosea]|uniref:Uncharacterized protein n=1 Tax=Armatimonas rosea TaxID=685828 RepID=A0A7W9SM70_ARMRO|nr:hypothetical protein [Armatimonas rosea]MBB6048910.1 hypothetical protein [Armatimonas rosea]
MSQTLYLVRLRSVFRVREIYDVRVDRILPQALFASQDAAEHFVQTNIPIEHNPFLRDGLWSVNVGTDWIDFMEILWERDLTWFLEKLQEIQLPSPEVYQWDWTLWWCEVTKNLKEQDKSRLCAWLELPPWGESLFAPESYYISMDGYVRLWYGIPLSKLIEYLTSHGLSLPDMLSGTKNWEFWWDETGPRMTDEQKAALWRLLAPQPWEIVEVELEKEKV